ncbi:MAG: M24 family metallopeptidase [Terriglobia bacterium]
MTRLEKVRNNLDKLGCDAAIISGAQNIRYLSGFSGSWALVLLTPSVLALVTDGRYVAQAEQELDSHLSRSESYEVIRCGGKADLAPVKVRLEAASVERIGYESHHVSAAGYWRLNEALGDREFVDVGLLVEKVRSVKDEAEIASIAEAAAIADKAFDHIIDLIEPGMAESDVALEIEVFMRKNGAEKVSFDVIVASGPRSAMPHALATDKSLDVGEFVKLDFGAVRSGYHSDMTRTVVLGRATRRQVRIHGLVRAAQERALESIEVGQKGRDIDAKARAVFAEAGEAEAFVHNLGHGVGLSVHERPVLGKESEEVLEPGMVFSIEPGLYYEGFGGVRVEDLVVLGQDGVRILTKSSRDLKEIG